MNSTTKWDLIQIILTLAKLVGWALVLASLAVYHLWGDAVQALYFLAFGWFLLDVEPKL